MEVFVLPADIKAKVDAQYERDVARMGHSTAGMESEYQSFLRVRIKDGGGGSQQSGVGMGGRGVGVRSEQGTGAGCAWDTVLLVWRASTSTTLHTSSHLKIYPPPPQRISTLTPSTTTTSTLTVYLSFEHLLYPTPHHSPRSPTHTSPTHPPTQELGGAPPPELMGEGGSGASGPSRIGGRPDVSEDCKLYVSSLPPSFSDTQLAAIFEPFGAVVSAKVMMDSTTGQVGVWGCVGKGSRGEGVDGCLNFRVMQLAAIFEPCGTAVSVKVIMDSTRGQAGVGEKCGECGSRCGVGQGYDGQHKGTGWCAGACNAAALVLATVKVPPHPQHLPHLHSPPFLSLPTRGRGFGLPTSKTTALPLLIPTHPPSTPHITLSLSHPSPTHTSPCPHPPSPPPTQSAA